MDIRQLSTPCYIINKSEYEKNILSFRAEFESRWGSNVDYGYSVKTNNFPYMLKTALSHGFYGEVVSPDEYEFALRCGCEESRIIFNGPQKRLAAVSALKKGAIVNLDNLEEVELVCRELSGTDFPGLVGLRLNFDLESLCPGETTCKGIPGRFGICLENGDFEKALDMLRTAGITLSGLHLHQSSSSRSEGIFRAIAAKAVEVGQHFGLNNLSYVDMGGGFFGGSFFPGKPTYSQYAEVICTELKGFYSPERTRLILEPGAAILATSMDYLASVLNIREVRGSRIVTLDGSLLHINPFMNPHPSPFTMIDGGEETDKEQIIAGSTCMELDRLWPRDMKNRAEHNTKFLFHCCGGYMSVHNSCFINAAPNIYLHENDEYSLLRKKSVDSLFL